MIEEFARVVAITEQGIWVETVRQSSCSSCSAAKGCGQKLLAAVGQGQRFEVLADNPRKLILQTGDRVVLGLAETALLQASALAYLLPLVTLIIAAVLADLSGQPEALIALFGVLGLALGLGVMKWVVGFGIKRGQFQPEILRTERQAAVITR